MPESDFTLRDRRSVLISLSTLSRICTLLLTAVTVSFGQTSRDAWKYGIDDEHVISDRNLDKYVSDLSHVEQLQIWQLIESDLNDPSKSVLDQKKSLLAMYAGKIRLSTRSAKLLLVQANGEAGFCGATGNCDVWLFTHDSGKLSLVLSANGVWIVSGKVSVKGMPDLTLRTHLSADDSQFTVYRWNGSNYKQTDCYTANQAGKVSGCS